MNVNLTDAQKIKILNADDVFAIMQKILLRENKIDRDKEHFWIVGLANNNKALFVELVSIGSVRATVVEPINVFRVAVIKNAVKVILVHNHPSGELKPSAEDQDVTDRLIQVGRIIDVEVIDHLIISPTSYLSFVDTGLFEELQASIKWVPTFEVVEKIRAEEQMIRKEAVKAAEAKGVEKGKAEGLLEGEEKGRKAEKIEMAKAMKAAGESTDRIANYTQLSVQEIEQL